MSDTELFCSILAFLISRHSYGNPTPKEVTVNRAGIRADRLGDAKDAFDDLRNAEFTVDCGNRGIQLDNSNFGALIDFLYHECDWSEMNLRTKFKHYEGWNQHDWASNR